MKNPFSYFHALIILGALSCADAPSRAKSFAGKYAREAHYPEIHMESGDTIGTMSFRDTIFIKDLNGQFHITNAVWKKIVYTIPSYADTNWVETRNTPAHLAEVNAETGLLNSVNPLLERIYGLQKDGAELIVNEREGAIYLRVE
jgi:hypothetical protein